MTFKSLQRRLLRQPHYHDFKATSERLPKIRLHSYNGIILFPDHLSNKLSSWILNRFILATKRDVNGNVEIVVGSDAGTVVQLVVTEWPELGSAFAVTSDSNVDQLGDGDNGDLGVQDDAELKC